MSKILHYPIKRSALASILKMHGDTLRARLRELGITHSRTLSPGEIRRIVADLELPDGVEIKW